MISSYLWAYAVIGFVIAVAAVIWTLRGVL